PISERDHRDFIASRSSASFLQTPGWAKVKREWHPESIGWHRGEELVGVALDRKSTRLNSSHVKISYAVFCLKKKKKRRKTRHEKENKKKKKQKQIKKKQQKDKKIHKINKSIDIEENK